MVEILSKEDVHTQREKSAAFVGSPEECRDMISDFNTQTGGFDIASLQVNTKMMSVDGAVRQRSAAEIRRRVKERGK